MKSCFEKAVELLGRRAHFRRELEQKLLRRGYETDEIAATLGRLEEMKYLDDERTAGAFVEARVERAPAGKPLLKNELAKRGVARTVVDEALAGVDEKEAVKEAAERFLRRRHRPKESAVERQQALLRHLASRGFSGYLARQAMEQLGSEIEMAEEAFELVEGAEESEGSSG